MNIRHFLARSIATVKRKPRYFPAEKWEDIDWSKDGSLRTHDFFRALEWLTGRELGVRLEVSGSMRNGNANVTYHTFEAKCWKLETDIRALFARIVDPVRVRVVTMQAVGGLPFSFPVGVHALTAESSNQGTSASSTSFPLSVTVGGAQRMVLMQRLTYNPTTPGWSYTGGAITALGSNTNQAFGYTWNGSTGSQTMTITANTSAFVDGTIACFTGASAVGNTASGTTSAAPSISGGSTVIGAIGYNPTGSTPSSLSCNQTAVCNQVNDMMIGMTSPGVATISFTVGGTPSMTTWAVEMKSPSSNMFFGFA